MISAALSSIDDRTKETTEPSPESPRHRPLPQIHPPSVSQMLATLGSLKATARSISTRIRNNQITTLLYKWGMAARQALIPAMLHDAAQEAFDLADTQFAGELLIHQALQACRTLLCSAWRIAGEIPDNASFLEQQAAETDLVAGLVKGNEPELFDNCSVTFHKMLRACCTHKWLALFPQSLQLAVVCVARGVRCGCGAWLQRQLCKDCYTHGRVRCDFTGELVECAAAWHCPKSHSSGLHPFGFDVAEDSVHDFQAFQQAARRYDRITQALLRQSSHNAAQPPEETAIPGDRAEAAFTTFEIRKAFSEWRRNGQRRGKPIKCSLESALALEWSRVEAKEVQSRAASEVPAEDLHEELRRAELELQLVDCVESLLPQVSNQFLAINDDLQNAAQADRSVDELRARHRWCRKLLQSRDWRTIRAGTQTQVEAIIAELSVFEDSISHENLRFRDPTHQAVAIDQAERE